MGGKKNHFKFKALNILLSSCHFIAHHCQWVSATSPTRRVFLTWAPRTACLTPNASRCPLHGGRLVPHAHGDVRSAHRLTRLPVSDIALEK